MTSEQQDIYNKLKALKTSLPEEQESIKVILSAFNNMASKANETAKAYKRLQGQFEFFERIKEQVVEILQKPASNMRYMQIANPARQSLNLLKLIKKTPCEM